MSSRSLASDLRALGRRGMAALRAVPAWLGGILTGIQGLLLSYLAILAPTLAVTAAAPGAGASAEDFGNAATFTTGLWLLAHGAPMVVGTTLITLVPLGLTLLCGAILAGVARRFAARTWGSWALAVATYTTGVALLASVVLPPERPGDLVRTTVVAALVAATGCAIGVWRAHGVSLPWLTKVPDWARLGLRRAAAMSMALVALAATVGAAWAFAGRQAIGDAATGLDLDPVGAGILAIAEVAYVPTMVAWFLAWLTGQGFAVGAGTGYAPDLIVAEPLPALPILGALPGSAGGWLVWAPLGIVAVAFGIRLALRRPALAWRRDVGADAVAVVLTAACGLALFVVSSGAAGPGRLAETGADLVSTTTALGMLVCAGTFLGTGIDHLVRRFTRRSRTASGESAVAPRKPVAATAG